MNTLKNKSIIILLAVFTILNFNCSKEDDADNKITSFDNEILQLINTHRQSLGKPALVMDSYMWDLANEHTNNMISGKVEFGHDGFDARYQAISAKYEGGGCAENVAYGYPDAQSVVDGWLNSSGHKANIEGNYNTTGLSAVQDKNGTWYYTQIFYNKN